MLKLLINETAFYFQRMDEWHVKSGMHVEDLSNGTCRLHVSHIGEYRTRLDDQGKAIYPQLVALCNPEQVEAAQQARARAPRMYFRLYLDNGDPCEKTRCRNICIRGGYGILKAMDRMDRFVELINRRAADRFLDTHFNIPGLTHLTNHQVEKGPGPRVCPGPGPRVCPGLTYLTNHQVEKGPGPRVCDTCRVQPVKNGGKLPIVCRKCLGLLKGEE